MSLGMAGSVSETQSILCGIEDLCYSLNVDGIVCKRKYFKNGI